MLTKEDKQERRIAKRKLRAAVLAHHFKDWKFRATDRQLRAGARIVADQILAGRPPLQP